MASNKSRQTFAQLLQRNLSYEEYMTLHDYLGVTKTRCTQLINNPEGGNSEYLVLLEKLLKKRNPEITAKVLVKEYHFAKDGLTDVEKKVFEETQAA